MSTPDIVTITGQVMHGTTPYVGPLKIIEGTTLRCEDGSVILPKERTIVPDGSGNFSFPAYVTDDPDWNPQDWAYTVWFSIGTQKIVFRLAPITGEDNNLGDLLSDGFYQPLEVAPINHTHAGYAATGHNHSGTYAPNVHSHDYAATGHTHDLTAYATDAELAALNSSLTAAISAAQADATQALTNAAAAVDPSELATALLPYAEFAGQDIDALATDAELAAGLNGLQFTVFATYDLITLAKNGFINVSRMWYKPTPGAPTTDTWATGDTVMDSAKVWWLCTAGGTPGTWV